MNAALLPNINRNSCGQRIKNNTGRRLLLGHSVLQQTIAAALSRISKSKLCRLLMSGARTEYQLYRLGRSNQADLSEPFAEPKQRASRREFYWNE